MLKKIVPIFIVLVAVMTACSSDQGNRELKSYVSSFLHDNPNAVAFGTLRVKDIFDKTDYKSHDKLNLLFGTELEKLERVIDFGSSVYFVAEGPLKEDGSPNALHLFLKIKNSDSLIAELNSRSFDVNKAGKIAYTEDGDFVLGVQNDLAIATIKSGDYDAKKLVKDNFKRTHGDESTGKIQELIAVKADFSMTMNMENLYGGSNTDLEKLPAERKAELKEMVKESFIQTTMRFEDGAAILESKHHFSEKLRNQMFFKSDASGSIVGKVNSGSGMMLAGLSMNLDFTKMENFYMKYSPESLEKISGILGLNQGMLSVMGHERILSSLGNGQFGITAVGNPVENSLNLNAFFGANETGKMVFSMFKGAIPLDLTYRYEKDGIYGSGSVMSGGEATAGGKVKVPEGCEVFGKKGITAFISLDGIDTEEFGFEGPMKLISILKYATFEYDENGGKLYIKAKDGKENILKQALDIMIDELASEIGGIAM